jgi:hypothetical protein
LATLWYFASASQHESDSSRVKRCRGVLRVPQVPSHQKKPAPTAQLRFWQNPASPPPPLGLLYRVSASFLSYSTYCCIMALKLANSASSGSCSSVESLRLPPVCCIINLNLKNQCQWQSRSPYLPLFRRRNRGDKYHDSRTSNLNKIPNNLVYQGRELAGPG